MTASPTELLAGRDRRPARRDRHLRAQEEVVSGPARLDYVAALAQVLSMAEDDVRERLEEALREEAA